MDLAELYYEFNFGFYPFSTDENKIKTQKTIAYLLEAGIQEKEVIKILETSSKGDYLTLELLPDYLWDDSFLKRSTFYYHKELQIRSEAPTMDMKTFKVEPVPFYLEMKIKYGERDILNYYYVELNIEPGLQNDKRDVGAIRHLLNQYSKFEFISEVDFILYLIDRASEDSNPSLLSIFDMDSKYRSEVYQMLKDKVFIAEAHKMNRIICR